MPKSTHFSGQPLYCQVIKLLDKSKILHFSRENGGERYTKRFNCWIHITVMLYAVIMRFDSLREITASLLAETRKLAHLGITFKIGRSTLADANEGVPSDIKFTSAATNDSFMLKPTTLSKGDIMAMDRAYIDYEKFQQLTERGVIYVTKMKKKLKYSILSDTMYQTPDGLMEVRLQHVEFVKQVKMGRRYIIGHG